MKAGPKFSFDGLLWGLIEDFWGLGELSEASNELSSLIPMWEWLSSSTSWILTNPPFLHGEFLIFPWTLPQASFTHFWATNSSSIDSCRWGLALGLWDLDFSLSFIVFSLIFSALAHAFPTICSSYASSIKVFWDLMWTCFFYLAGEADGFGFAIFVSTFIQACPTIFSSYCSSRIVFWDLINGFLADFSSIMVYGKSCWGGCWRIGWCFLLSQLSATAQALGMISLRAFSSIMVFWLLMWAFLWVYQCTVWSSILDFSSFCFFSSTVVQAFETIWDNACSSMIVFWLLRCIFLPRELVGHFSWLLSFWAFNFSASAQPLLTILFSSS